MRTLCPGLREHLAPRVDYVVHDRTVDVGAIDVELDEAELLALNILSDRRRALFFWAVRWGNRAGDDDGMVKIARNVFLVAVEPLRTAFAAMTHLGVLY